MNEKVWEQQYVFLTSCFSYSKRKPSDDQMLHLVMSFSGSRPKLGPSNCYSLLPTFKDIHCK
jgi:hypothetical protein